LREHRDEFNRSGRRSIYGDLDASDVECRGEGHQYYHQRPGVWPFLEQGEPSHGGRHRAGFDRVAQMNARREGFTLVEIMIVVLLGSIIMGSIYQMVVLQEKTTRSQYAQIQTSENTQMALAVVTNDLKEISARDSDIVALDSTSI